MQMQSKGIGTVTKRIKRNSYAKESLVPAGDMPRLARLSKPLPR